MFAPTTSSFPSMPKARAMHIAFVIPSLHGGGAEFVVRQWITALSAEGHRTTIYAYAREQPHVDLPRGAAVHSLPSRGGPLRLALMPFWLRVRTKRDAPDVVLSLLPFSNVIALLALRIWTRRSVPLMVSERNVPTIQVANTKRRDRLTAWLARRLYSRASGALAISHPVAANLVSAFGVRADDIYVVPNPVVPSAVGGGPPPVSTPARLHLALVGRHVRQKRPHLFLQVLQELEQRGVAVRGTVIGDGPLREATERECAQLGLTVSFLGWREPWWEAASDIDCLVLTANAEGFANVLVEAAAAQIPSVASSRALGVADAIVPGVTGVFAMGDSPAAYADAVLSAASIAVTPTVRIADWLNHFSTENSTATLLTALRSVIEGNQATH
jgi:glycosyltransferase involved in cell wall biosynthesis